MLLLESSPYIAFSILYIPALFYPEKEPWVFQDAFLFLQWNNNYVILNIFTYTTKDGVDSKAL